MNDCRQRCHRNPGAACWLCLPALICGIVAIRLLLFFPVVSAAEESPSQSTVESVIPPAMKGRYVRLDSFRLRVDCEGEGDVTILFEPGLGGSAFEWQPLQQTLKSRARSCVYDRAGYGWSGSSPYPRTARRLATEANRMLAAMDINGPLILVGHSFGGFVMRLLALQRAENILALVLIDSSHESQLERLEKLNGRSMMPSGNSFVISPADIPASLPADVQNEIRRFSQTRKAYAALHSEMSRFRESADQVRRSRVVVPYPVVVIRRGRDLHTTDYKGDLKTAIWKELQQDLVTLSERGRIIVAEQSGHHVHADQPELVVNVIISLIDEHAALEKAARR